MEVFVQRASADQMETSAARGDFGVGVKIVDDVLRQLRNLPSVRIADMIKVDEDEALFLVNPALEPILRVSVLKQVVK